MRLLPLIAGTALLLAAGGCDARSGEPDAGRTPPQTTTIRRLCEAYAGQTFRIDADVVVEGCVTANDRGGNFYRTLAVEQEGAGMIVMAAVDYLQNDYPVGCRVTLRLKGLAVGMSYGVLQIGTMPGAGSAFATDYIPSKPALDAVLARSTETLSAPVPTVRTLQELTPAACGTLVRIENLHYTPEELTSGTWAGYKRFTDGTGAAIDVYVSEYARFAGETVPAERCSLTGVLQQNGGSYLLKLRDESDCLVY